MNTLQSSSLILSFATCWMRWAFLLMLSQVSVVKSKRISMPPFVKGGRGDFLEDFLLTTPPAPPSLPPLRRGVCNAQLHTFTILNALMTLKASSPNLLSASPTVSSLLLTNEVSQPVGSMRIRNLLITPSPDCCRDGGVVPHTRPSFCVSIKYLK